MDNLKGINLLESYNLLRLTQEEIQKYSANQLPVIISVNNLKTPVRQSPESDEFTRWSLKKHLKKELTPILLKLF